MYVQIPDFPDYMVDERGSVVSLAGRVWRELKPVADKKGYLQVQLTVGPNQRSTQKVHRLVLRAFEGPSNLAVNHINGIKSDNRLENLEYCTAAHNNAHAWANGFHERTRRRAAEANSGDGNGQAKLTEEQALRLLELRPVLTREEASKLFDLSLSHVSDIWNGNKWKHLQSKARMWCLKPEWATHFVKFPVAPHGVGYRISVQKHEEIPK